MATQERPVILQQHRQNEVVVELLQLYLVVGQLQPVIGRARLTDMGFKKLIYLT